MNKEEFEKKCTELMEDCNPSNYAKICKLLESATKLNKNELNCVTRVANEAKGAEEYNLEYLPKHFNTLNKGESVRMSPTRFAWIKEAMIVMQYASQNSTRYMNNFIRLKKEDRDKLPVLMACFEEITSAAKKINTLTGRKRKPNGNKQSNKSKKSSVAPAKDTVKAEVAKESKKPTKTAESQGAEPVASKTEVEKKTAIKAKEAAEEAEV